MGKLVSKSRSIITGYTGRFGHTGLLKLFRLQSTLVGVQSTQLKKACVAERPVYPDQLHDLLTSLPISCTNDNAVEAHCYVG